MLSLHAFATNIDNSVTFTGVVLIESFISCMQIVSESLVLKTILVKRRVSCGNMLNTFSSHSAVFFWNSDWLSHRFLFTDRQNSCVRYS